MHKEQGWADDGLGRSPRRPRASALWRRRTVTRACLGPRGVPDSDFGADRSASSPAN